jgi:hypothetical protein
MTEPDQFAILKQEVARLRTENAVLRQRIAQHFATGRAKPVRTDKQLAHAITTNSSAMDNGFANHAKSVAWENEGRCLQNVFQ